MRAFPKKTIPNLALLTGVLLSSSLFGCASSHNACSRLLFGFESKENGQVQVRPSKKTAASYAKTGQFYQMRKEYALAIESFQAAVQIDPSYFAAYNSLGICYDQLKMFPEAVTAYRTALQLEGNRDEAHNNLGYSFLLQGNFEAAIASFTQAISLSKTHNRRYYNNLGLAYTKKGLYAEAYRAFLAVSSAARAQKTLVALAPTPALAQEFFLAPPLTLDAETRYQSTGMEVPTPPEVVPAKPAARPAAPEPVSLPGSPRKPLPAATQPLVVAIRPSNGNAVIAANLGQFLSRRGGKVRILANMPTYSGPTTIYFGMESLQEAYHLAQLIPGYQLMEQNDALPKNTLRVVVGEDLALYFNAGPDLRLSLLAPPR